MSNYYLAPPVHTMVTEVMQSLPISEKIASSLNCCAYKCAYARDSAVCVDTRHEFFKDLLNPTVPRLPNLFQFSITFNREDIDREERFCVKNPDITHDTFSHKHTHTHTVHPTSLSFFWCIRTFLLKHFPAGLFTTDFSWS